MTVVPLDPRSKAGEGFCAPGGKGSGLAEAQQAARSTSGIVSGHSDCEATGAGWAQAANRIKGSRNTERIIGSPNFQGCNL